MTKIYVGNLPFSATDAEIRELFAAHGTVESVSIITDRDTGRPRGFGFVEEEEAGVAELVVENCKEGLAMGVVMKRHSAEAINNFSSHAWIVVPFVDLCRKAEQALCAKVEAFSRTYVEGKPQGFRKLFDRS